DGSVRPVQAWPGVGAAQDGDLVPQHEELDVLGGGRAAHQQDHSEHLPEDHVQQPQRHAGIMPNQRSPLVSDPGTTSGTPHAWVAQCRVPQHQVGAGPWTRCTIPEITRYTPNAPAASTTIVRPYR